VHGVEGLEGQTSKDSLNQVCTTDFRGAIAANACYPFERSTGHLTDLNVERPRQCNGEVRCRGDKVRVMGEIIFSRFFIDDETDRHDAEQRFECTLAPTPHLP